MRRRELLAETRTPDGMRMTLSFQAGNYSIDVDGRELMSSRAPGSEQAMAELAARELAGTACPRVLVGGLGLGFTLSAALDALPATAVVVVVEFFATIVDWNRKFGFQSARDLLADRRLVVEVADVVDYLGRVTTPFDAILLDVDNGPDAWCLASNDRLYRSDGLARIKAALKPGGLLVVWSAEESPPFEKRLGAAGFSARSETVRSRERKGERHTLFVAFPDPG
jgi:spermidine synthase